MRSINSYHPSFVLLTYSCFPFMLVFQMSPISLQIHSAPFPTLLCPGRRTSTDSTSVRSPMGLQQWEPQPPRRREEKEGGVFSPGNPAFPFFLHLPPPNYQLLRWADSAFPPKAIHPPSFLNLLRSNSHTINFTTLKYAFSVVYSLFIGSGNDRHCPTPELLNGPPQRNEEPISSHPSFLVPRSVGSH